MPGTKAGKKVIVMDFTLRKWRDSDLESLVRHANNFKIAKNLTDQFPHPYSPEDGVAYLDMIRDDDPVKVFAIEVNGEAVGSIGIFPQSDIHRKGAEIGYWLAEDYWGNGIIPRAIERVVRYGFETFDITRVFARPFGTNAASQRVLEKANFKQEARLERALFKNGEYKDELIYVRFKE